MNFAENVLDPTRHGDALIAFSESSPAGENRRAISWSELRQRVKKTADALHGSGLQPHDVVACTMTFDA